MVGRDILSHVTFCLQKYSDFNTVIFYQWSQCGPFVPHSSSRYWLPLHRGTSSRPVTCPPHARPSAGRLSPSPTRAILTDMTLGADSFTASPTTMLTIQGMMRPRPSEYSKPRVLMSAPLQGFVHRVLRKVEVIPKACYPALDNMTI